MNIASALQSLVEQHPKQVLFEEAEHALSAQALLQSATSLATQLQQLGIPPQSNIGINLPRGIPASTAIYAILLMGGCYVPLDPQSPHNRLAYIAQDADTRCIIGVGECPQWVAALKRPYLDLQNTQITPDKPFIAPTIDPEHLAALLYTSGSTGQPKGVAISHRAIMAFVKWAQATFSLQKTDRIANLAPYHFDLSLFDLFAGPLTGATTLTLPDRLKLAPGKLVDWLANQNISSWYTVPSILGFLVLKGGLAEKSLPRLRQILFAGEVFPTPKLRQLNIFLPNTKLYNLFGPTETNVCLYWPLEATRLASDAPIPIGNAACDAELMIAPESNELLLKGDCLMTGYWHNGAPRLPLDAQGWFHTGDKVAVNEVGEYEYHGRLDRMIKSAGYRIEPAEIEAMLNMNESVSACAVISTSDAISGTRIIAAVAGKNLNQQTLRKYMHAKLPAYMQPARYLVLEKLPMLSNGKTDYRTIERMTQPAKT